MNKSVAMAYGGNKKISALRWRFIHHDGVTIADLTVGHFSILFTRLQAAKSVLGIGGTNIAQRKKLMPCHFHFALQS